MYFELVKPFFRNSLIESAFNESNASWKNFSPKVDITEEADHYLLKMDLPGVKKEDVKIELKDNVLKVSGERKSERSEEDENCSRSEIRYGSFTRSFNVEGVNQEKIDAKFENGVLKLQLSKAEEQKRKEISIN